MRVARREFMKPFGYKSLQVPSGMKLCGNLRRHYCCVGWLFISCVRAAERMGGAQGRYKKRGPYIDCARGVWGHAPRKF